MIAHYHVRRVGTARVMHASVEFPVGAPPEFIRIGGDRWMRLRPSADAPGDGRPGPLTRALRKACEGQGRRYERGYPTVGGTRLNEDNVTTVYPMGGDAGGRLTFEEDMGVLYCLDELDVAQALGCVDAGGAR